MQLHPYVDHVQAHLAATASLGDDSTRATAEALATAAEASVRLALLGAVANAADEITTALLDSPGAPTVVIRLDGDDLRVEVRMSAPAEPATEDAAAATENAEHPARISLRLPEALKGQIEVVARAHGISVNTWLVRAASTSLSVPVRGGRRTFPWETGNAQHLTGWLNS